MQEHADWVTEVFQLIERHFDDPWYMHIRALNAQYGLAGDAAFSAAGQDEPPTFFNGAVEALRPGRWTLVVSLNPHRPLSDETAPEEPGHRFASMVHYWDFWREMNTRDWYPRFYGPLVRLAASALGDEVARGAEPTYAQTRMLFVELCPYGSHRFRLTPSQLTQLADSDVGFIIARAIFRLAAGEGRPALILVNGHAAVGAMDALEGDRVQWAETLDVSPSNPAKRLRHWEGSYRGSHGQVPIAGFPFLNTIWGYNANAEKAQLAGQLRDMVAQHEMGTG